MKTSCYYLALLLIWTFLGSELTLEDHTQYDVNCCDSVQPLAVQITSVNGSVYFHSNIRYFLYQSVDYPRDCEEVFSQCSSSNVRSGIYLIKPDGYPEPFEVYCDNYTSVGWSVIQRRFDDFISFTRNWNDYKYGFGFLGSEFWIGNEKLSYLTNQKRYQLLINMETTEGESYDLTYDDFRISDEWGKYSLSSVGNCSKISEFNIVWCAVNKQYKNGSICERSCENPNVCIPSNSSEPERCICDENHMIHEGRCIPREQCGCYVPSNNGVLMEAESFINSVCTWRVSCRNNSLVNETYSCSIDATCEESNGSGNCTCNQWFEGDGANCTRHPCYVKKKGRVLAEGENYVNSVCSTIITCSNKRLTRESYGCSDDATCVATNGEGVCNCNEWFEGNGRTCTRNGPRDCSDLYRAGRRRDMVYTIYPSGSSGFEVYCEMSDGGWTILQKRTSGYLGFYRNWNSYKYGFGSIAGDHWLGNEKIYTLTNQDSYQLRIEKTNAEGSSYYSRYSSFRIRDEGQSYRLYLSGYYGNAGNNAMGASSGYRFSTYDDDNDGSSTYDCAEKHRGGWWYPDDSSTGSTEYCYTFSKSVSTGRYQYSDCVCLRCDEDCAIGEWHGGCWGGGGCRLLQYQYYRCKDCGGCSGWEHHRWCRYKEEIQDTTWYRCGYSNLNGDYQYNDYRGIWWKGLYGSDCGITETKMKIRRN